MVLKCPYCGKKLEPFERFCYQCEHDVSKVTEKSQEPKVTKPKKRELKKDVENIKAMIQGIKSKIKKKGKEAPKAKKVVKIEKIDSKLQAYCVKCKKKVTIKDPKDYKMKNGFLAAKGTCPKCSTKVFRIVKKIQ